LTGDLRAGRGAAAEVRPLPAEVRANPEPVAFDLPRNLRAA